MVGARAITPREEAVAAAKASGISIRAVAQPDELDRLRAVMNAVWGPEVVPPRNVLRGLALAGASLLVARRERRPVGFAIGWMGWANGVHFHSHQVGVIAKERSSGVGFALKLAQRASCLHHGVDEMRWTFDPLLGSNAQFNVLRLGAVITAFRPNCYGDRGDAFNAGDFTDRVEVSWKLDQPVGGTAVAPVRSAGSLVAVSPSPTRSAVVPVAGALIPIPRAYHRLRGDDVDLGRAWRTAVWSAMNDTYAAGLTIRGLCADGYVLGEGEAAQSEHSP